VHQTATALPPLQNAWLATLTGIRDPAPEPKATCRDCVMCAGEQVSGSKVLFVPSVKCCSYLPNVPNFLAGRALHGSGGHSIQARIAGRSGVTPLGLGLTSTDVTRLIDAHPRFGRSAEVLCPHFEAETQGCGIWQDRNAVCSTWFCQHERGALSQRFWHAVRDLLIAAEERLAHRFLTVGGLPESQISAVLQERAGVRETITAATAKETPGPDAAGVDGRVDVPDEDVANEDHANEEHGGYERLWGSWQGREEAWFEQCAQALESVRDEELLEVMRGVPHLADGVVNAWADLHTQNPPEQSGPLRLRPREGSAIGTDLITLVGYSDFDPVRVPAELLRSLLLLDGRSSAQALEEIDRTHGAPLGHDLVRQLQDFGILTADGDQGQSAP
jgi:hypothetical protein